MEVLNNPNDSNRGPPESIKHIQTSNKLQKPMPNGVGFFYLYKHTLIMAQDFSVEQGIAIQQEHLERWRTVLTDDAFIAAKKFAEATNNEAKNGYGIRRGTTIDNFICNYSLEMIRRKRIEAENKNKRMFLCDIIEKNEDHGTSLLYEKVAPYLKMLYTYYKRTFCCEVIVMVTSISNAAQYVKFVPADEFTEAMYEWDHTGVYHEEISFNSKLLKDLIQ